MKKLSTLLQCQIFANLLKRFLDDDRIMKIIESNKMSENPEAYKEAASILIKAWGNQ